MKPTVFNYQEYERVVEENKKLNAEVADLRIRIADGDKRDCKSCKHQKSDGCSRWNCEYEPRMDGLISRQDAIEAVATVTMSIHLSNVLCDKLLALPSADRPTGEWVKALDGCERHVKCTHCFKTYDWHSEAKHYNYCPNCGARMEGGEEE